MACTSLTGAASELLAAFVPTASFALLPAALVAPILFAGLRHAKRSMPGLTMVTAAPVGVTFLALTVTRFYVEMRFLSYLLVPILVVAAFGLKGLATAPGSSYRRALSTTYSVLAVSVVLLVFAFFSGRHSRIPEEANRKPGRRSPRLSRRHPSRPVMINTVHPNDVLYYARAVRPLPHGSTEHLQRFICSDRSRSQGLILVQQPYGIRPVDASCLERSGATAHVFRQWDCGGRITVWQLPPAKHI